jgi:hypothetical protein
LIILKLSRVRILKKKKWGRWIYSLLDYEYRLSSFFLSTPGPPCLWTWTETYSIGSTGDTHLATAEVFPSYQVMHCRWWNSSASITSHTILVRFVYKLVNRSLHRWMDGCMDGLMEGSMDEWMEKCRHIYIFTDIYVYIMYSISSLIWKSSQILSLHI